MTFDLKSVVLEASKGSNSGAPFFKLFQSSPMAMAIGRVGRHLAVNDRYCDLVGYPREELVGRSASALGLWAEKPRRRRLLELLRERDRVEAFELRLRRKSGEIRTVVMNVEVLSAGSDPCYLLMVSDVTQLRTGRRRVQSAVLNAAEREQRRIGRDLHDSLGQHLTALSMLSRSLELRLRGAAPEAAADAARLAGLAREASELVRAAAAGLDPADPGADGLPAALKELAAGADRLFGVKCEVRAEEGFKVAGPATALHLYRIAQEAVSNAVRHGRGRRIRISLSRRGERLRLSVEDDGQGLAAEIPGAGMGLRTMRRRCGALLGRLSLGKSRWGGAKVVCSCKDLDFQEEL